MDIAASSPFYPIGVEKPRKASFSSAGGTLDSSLHSSILGDSFRAETAGSCVDAVVHGTNNTDEPYIRQLRHSGTAFGSETCNRAATINSATRLPALAKENIEKHGLLATARVEDRFASHMNMHQGDEDFARLRNMRRTERAVIVEEGEDDNNGENALDKSLAKFWEREKKKSVHCVTCNLHYLVLVGEEDKVTTYGGHQFMQGMP